MIFFVFYYLQVLEFAIILWNLQKTEGEENISLLPLAFLTFLSIYIFLQRWQTFSYQTFNILDGYADGNLINVRENPPKYKYKYYSKPKALETYL